MLASPRASDAASLPDLNPENHDFQTSPNNGSRRGSPAKRASSSDAAQSVQSRSLGAFPDGFGHDGGAVAQIAPPGRPGDRVRARVSPGNADSGVRLRESVS